MQYRGTRAPLLLEGDPCFTEANICTGCFGEPFLCLLLPADVYQAHQQWQVPQVLPPYEVLAQWVPGAGLWLRGMAFALMAWSFAPAVCLGVSCCRHSQQRFTAAEYCKRSDPLPGRKRVVGLRWGSVLVVQLVFKAWRQVSDTPWRFYIRQYFFFPL